VDSDWGKPPQPLLGGGWGGGGGEDSNYNVLFPFTFPNLIAAMFA